MLNFFPKYFTSKAIYLYLGVMVLVTFLFFNRALPFVWWIFGLVEVVGFFYFSNRLPQKWANLTPKSFTKKLFILSILLRLIWVLFSYIFYTEMTGQPFEFSAADAAGYHGEALWLVDMMRKGNIDPYFEYINGRYSDMGYPFYLGLQYFITDNSIIIARLLKALYGAWMAVLIYKLSARTFGESVGRMAALFVALMPNLILYTGLHLKEIEMVLLAVLFVERADYMLRAEKFRFWDVLTTLLIAGVLFFFRTVLGATALFSLFSALAFSSGRVVKFNKKLIIGIWVFAAIVYFMGGRIATEVEEVWQERTTSQQQSMEWRAQREGGNKFSSMMNKSFFAPAIFIIPFPTMVKVDGQENQMLIHGGNFVKNMMAFFALFAVFFILKEKRWREYTLIGSFLFGYLIVIALSAFAHSERFHLPAVPFLLIMAAYGISRMTNKEKKYYTLYLLFIFVAIVGWSWFKLAGRGMI